MQGGRYPYVYVDDIYLRRNWGGEYENVSVLVAIAVNEDGFRHQNRNILDRKSTRLNSSHVT